jgi:hypothetical protein
MMMSHFAAAKMSCGRHGAIITGVMASLGGGCEVGPFNWLYIRVVLDE